MVDTFFEPDSFISTSADSLVEACAIASSHRGLRVLPWGSNSSASSLAVIGIRVEFWRTKTRNNEFKFPISSVIDLVD